MSGSAERKVRWASLSLLAVLCCLGLATGPDRAVRAAHAQAAIEGTGESSEEAGDTLSEAAQPRPDRRWRGTREDVVRIGEGIVVEEDEKITGDVVAIGGVVRVHGHVTGDVVSIGGGVKIRDGGYIGGDAVCVGGRVELDEGGTIRGESVSIGAWPFGVPGVFRIGGETLRRPESTLLRIWWDLLRYAGFFLVGMILYLAFPRRFEVGQSTIRSRFWLSLVTGFGAGLGSIILLVLLVITCIGILIAIPGFFLIVLAFVAGGAAVLGILGERILKRPGTARSDWILSFAIGLLAIFVVQLFSRLVAMTPGVGGGVSGVLDAIVKTAWFVFLVTGFGALLLSRLGAGPKRPAAASIGTEPPQSGHAPPGPPPPIG